MHKDHLRQVFWLLEANSLVIRKDKCVFGVSKINFLGHRVTPAGVLPLPDRVTVLQEYPVPENKAALQRFLGMINYYHRFLPKIAGHFHPLHVASAGRGQEVEWSLDCQTAFEKAKAALAAATASMAAGLAFFRNLPGGSKPLMMVTISVAGLNDSYPLRDLRHSRSARGTSNSTARHSVPVNF